MSEVKAYFNPLDEVLWYTPTLGEQVAAKGEGSLPKQQSSLSWLSCSLIKAALPLIGHWIPLPGRKNIPQEAISWLFVVWACVQITLLLLPSESLHKADPYCSEPSGYISSKVLQQKSSPQCTRRKHSVLAGHQRWGGLSIPQQLSCAICTMPVGCGIFNRHGSHLKQDLIDQCFTVN